MTHKMTIVFVEQGGHTHMRVYAGRIYNVSLGKAGDLVLTNEEFAAWRGGTMKIEFVSGER